MVRNKGKGKSAELTEWKPFANRTDPVQLRKPLMPFGKRYSDKGLSANSQFRKLLTPREPNPRRATDNSHHFEQPNTGSTIVRSVALGLMLLGIACMIAAVLFLSGDIAIELIVIALISPARLIFTLVLSAMTIHVLVTGKIQTRSGVPIVFHESPINFILCFAILAIVMLASLYSTFYMPI